MIKLYKSHLHTYPHMERCWNRANNCNEAHKDNIKGNVIKHEHASSSTCSTKKPKPNRTSIYDCDLRLLRESQRSLSRRSSGHPSENQAVPSPSCRITGPRPPAAPRAAGSNPRVRSSSSASSSCTVSSGSSPSASV